MQSFKVINSFSLENHDDDEDGSGQEDDNESGDAGLQHIEDRLILARFRRRAEVSFFCCISQYFSTACLTDMHTCHLFSENGIVYEKYKLFFL